MVKFSEALLGGAHLTVSRGLPASRLAAKSLAPELSADERVEVKKVVRELLNRLKQLLVLNWRQKSSARSQIKLTSSTKRADAHRVYKRL